MVAKTVQEDDERVTNHSPFHIKNFCAPCLRPVI